MNADLQTEQRANPAHPRWNALKHGLRSAAPLLPGEDGAQLTELRRDLYFNYRPRTGDEVACVETMALNRWRIARCQRWGTVCDAQIDALMFGEDGAEREHICEPELRKWMQESKLAVEQEGRLDRLMCRARDKLLLLQKLRRNNLIAGAIEEQPILWPADLQDEGTSSATVDAAGEDEHSASPSQDREFREVDEQAFRPSRDRAVAHGGELGSGESRAVGAEWGKMRGLRRAG